MNTDSPWFAALILIVVAAVGFAWYKWFKVFNSPAGERYRKLRMQGPFVPGDGTDGTAPRQ